MDITQLVVLSVRWQQELRKNFHNLEKVIEFLINFHPRNQERTSYKFWK